MVSVLTVSRVGSRAHADLDDARATGAVDVHQHLWPAQLLDQLRRRTTPPLLRGWTLYTAGEPPYDVDPVAHDPQVRTAAERDRDRVVVSLSAPLGIECLPPDEAAPLLAAWHEGVLALGDPWRGWASVSAREPDLDRLTATVEAGFVGLQVGADLMASPGALEALAPVLAHCESLDVPVLVHPGPVPPTPGAPAWWPAVQQYPAQLQAAWWSWAHAGRALLPSLRICFVAGAGLAPLHHERFVARGGRRLRVDPLAFVDTSSYGRQAVDHLTRALGIDPVVLGSDRPYAEPFETDLGAAAVHAISVTNPRRLLKGAHP